jgi:hypothetical protein
MLAITGVVAHVKSIILVVLVAYSRDIAPFAPLSRLCMKQPFENTSNAASPEDDPPFMLNAVPLAGAFIDTLPEALMVARCVPAVVIARTSAADL